MMPTMPLAELCARYDALGPIEDHPFERTWRSRCETFEYFVEYGPLIASDLAALPARAVLSNEDDWPEDAARLLAWHEKDHPGLLALILAAWPDAKPRRD